MKRSRQIEEYPNISSDMNELSGIVSKKLYAGKGINIYEIYGTKRGKTKKRRF